MQTAIWLSVSLTTYHKIISFLSSSSNPLHQDKARLNLLHLRRNPLHLQARLNPQLPLLSHHNSRIRQAVAAIIMAMPHKLLQAHSRVVVVPNSNRLNNKMIL